jgi:hypothetical protein
MKRGLNKDYIRMLFRRLFHVRIKRLHPIVALTSGDVELIYGRYDCYNEYNQEGNPHNVIMISGKILECFTVKKLTEEQYFNLISHK